MQFLFEKRLEERAAPGVTINVILGICTMLILGVLFHSSLAYMVKIWLSDANYGHGLFVPLISLYIFWLNRKTFKDKIFKGSWAGTILVLIGILLFVVGELATLYIVQLFSFWILIVGFFISIFGISTARQALFPLSFLILMIPLPQFVFQSLSQKLQLISSSVGVGFLQLSGITAFQEGNVIDLGPIQLQVAEACSGIRYLLPLMALALLCAYLLKDKMWKRVLLFLSSIPISILLNGFRIGMIGMLVEWYGKEPAEGFYHLFEGWVLFLVSLGLLLGVAWFLTLIRSGKSSKSLLNQFEINIHTSPHMSHSLIHSQSTASKSMNAPYLTSFCLLLPLVFFSFQIESREEIAPQRQVLLDFPMQLGGWNGSAFGMEKVFADTLKLDDYLLADYHAQSASAINLFVAYYGSQKKGRSAHSPRSCIPGDGWEITSIESMQIQENGLIDSGVHANLVTIQKGNKRQLVVYWFQQRGRTIANEYLVKMYLLWDALTRNRTDGALVRLIADMKPGTQVKDVQTDLLKFAALLHNELPRYVPN